MNVSPLLPAAGIAAATLARGAVAAVTDGLSFAAELLRPEKPAESEATVAEPTPTRAQFEAAVREFSTRLRQRLAAAGVSAPQGVELVSDGLGGIQVSGEHPERALIEQTLNGDPDLLAEFQKLAGQCRQLTPTTDERDRRDFGLLIQGDQSRPFWV